MSHNVVFSPEAADDLLRLAEFLADTNPGAALRAVEAITKAILSLTDFPERGRQVGDKHRELVIQFGTRAYIAEYAVYPAEVFVGRIFHSREDRRFPP